MADLSINKSDNVKINEGAGQNMITNGDFESAPSFTAATTTTARFIDGTAGGSTTDDSHVWAIANIVGSGSAQFDNSTSNSGTYSLKVSTIATSSRIQIGDMTSFSGSANFFKYAYPVQPSTTYKLTYAMKTNYVSGDSSNGALVQLFDVDATGAVGSSTSSSAVKITTGWTNYTLSRTTASTAAYIFIELNIFGNTGTSTLIMDAWFDDLVLKPVARQNGVDLQVTPLVTAGIQDISGPKIWS